jgi:CheY-like chemotaxis protein
MQTVKSSRSHRLDLARVLVVDDDPASRLTLQTVLEAGGYRVDSAATAAEAVEKLDGQEYELVLSDLQMESPEAGLKVIAYAQCLEYQPATALINSESHGDADRSGGSLLIAPQDIPGLLSKVATLIARRVTRRVKKELRQSKN